MQPPDVGGFNSLLESVKPVLPIPVLVLAVAGLWWFFRGMWKELDDEATDWRVKLKEQGKTDLRPVVALVLCAFILTVQEYYGGRVFYDQAIRPALVKLDIAHPKTIKLWKYDELYGFGWWVFTRVAGYVLPLAVWPFAFKQDSLRDMGFRIRGLWKHMWIYGVLLLLVLGPQLVVVRSPDFGTYYPFYKLSSRSWYDFLSWEAMYFAQFLALEVFFRGWWLGALRKAFGSGAVFAMIVPYCMIHYGKPYLEANGAILAGIVLGTLAMRTKSIWGGVMLHITVAGLMDWLALLHRHALPSVFWPPG